MSARLLVRAAGPGVTLQDAGRFGLSRYGVTPAGPMDADAFLAATQAVGAATAVEVSLGGAVFEAEGATVAVAVAGGAFDIRLDGRPLPPACVATLAPGAQLALRPGAAGAWCYVAPAAEIDVAPTLGSRASHTRSGIGPAALRAGDALALLSPCPAPADVATLHAPWLAPAEEPIRALPGPQADYFSPQTLAGFFAADWRLSPRSDRMAYALQGPLLRHARGHDIVSDGAVMGAIQIPGDGAPFVLMADRQPTGGYPKIACVIGADLGRLAQMRPGATVRFAAVSWEAAVAARRQRQTLIAAGVRLEPLADLSSATLLGENLVGGVVSARE